MTKSNDGKGRLGLFDRLANNSGWLSVFLVGLVLSSGVGFAQVRLNNGEFKAWWRVKEGGEDLWADGSRISKNSAVFALSEKEAEAVVKLLQVANGAWRSHLVVFPDRISHAFLQHRRSGAMWISVTGTAREVFRDYGGAYPDRRVVCSWPRESAVDVFFCSWGSAWYLNDAFDSRGRIPEKYFVPDTRSSARIDTVIRPSDGLQEIHR